MRACFPRLAMLVVIGVWPAAGAWGQVAPVETAIGAEQPASEHPPASAASGSQPNSGPIESPKPVAGPAVEASQLDTFLLRDSKGNLVPILGLPFEEFEQLLRLKKGLAAPAAPAYVLESLSIAGTVDERTADLQLTATIRVREEEWVRVPLGMPTVVVRQASKHEGPGEHFLAYDSTLGGYVCWLKGNDARPHVVTLSISAAVHVLGTERRLALSVPRATESSLRLITHEPHVEASLAAGEGIVSTRSLDEERSEISVLGPAGEMQLAWRPGREVTEKGPTQLDASGEIAVRIESEHRITSDARLRVRSNGAPLESFRVRLPPGMELVALPPTGGFSIAPLTASSEQTPSPKKPSAQLVGVRLDKPATTSIEILLRAQRQADAAGPADLFPARFEVLGAVRQRGTIDFTMDGEWQLDFTEDKSVHRLDLTPDTAAARIVARFEYFRQPCPLELKVAARPSRVSVEPTHTVFVDPQRVRIETVLRYRFRGARATGLTFELGDWNFDRLTPDTLLDVPIAASESPGQLKVPFRAGVAPPTELELKLEAHRPLPPGTERIALTFPRPVGDIVAPAMIAISAADNVELTPHVAELVGLSTDPTAVRVPGRQQSPLVYRDLGGGEPALFAAGMRTLARSTTTSAKASVRIDRQQAQVDQKIDYRILHEPQRLFSLLAPREVLAAGNLQVWFNGEPLAVTPAADASAATTLARLQFSTPTDQIGTFQVSVRYAVPLRYEGQNPLTMTLPLVLPVDEEDDQFAGQQLEFTLAEGLQLEPALEGIDESLQPTPLGGDSIHAYSWANPPSLSRWTVEPSQATQTAPVMVSKMWVQTWLAPQSRQERVALRLVTQQETVRVQLPKGVKQASVQTAIDGHEVPRNVRDPGILMVTIPAAARGHECVLEVFYTLDSPERQLGLLSDRLRTAQIDAAAAPRRVYWQLALPEAEHLVLPPAELAAEMAWPGQNILAARRPVMDQRQLEAWIKASRQEPLPRGVNEYLFGTLGRWPTLQVTSAHRGLLVSLASGGILALGLLLVHVPRCRSPGLLLSAAVFIAAVAVVAPDFGVLAGQGAVLGLLVTGLAAAWTSLAAGRAIFPSRPVSTIVSRAAEAPSTQPPTARPERSSRITTPAPAGAAVMEVRP